jgi:dTDP-4-dehydrorhamnose reductase
MILLLGGTGYVGTAFAAELRSRGRAFVALSRRDADYTRFDVLFNWLKANRPDFVVNCAGYTGKPNVDACETARADTLVGNTLLPAVIGHACAALGIPWGHVSSGCIFAGAKVRDDAGLWRVEKDLNRPWIRELAARHPERFRGFSEDDAPNFSFRDGPCSFYSGSKALGEEAVAGGGTAYVWRLRIPFDHEDNGRNYLSKVQRYAKVYDNLNSLSHRGDFAKACVDLFEKGAMPGVYNVTNPGWVSTRSVIAKIERRLNPGRKFEFWESDEEFYRTAAKTPRSNCIMDTSKLTAAGVTIRTVEEALDDALDRWTPESR